MNRISSIIAFIILLIAAVIIFLYSGVYNVAATIPHTKVTLWVLSETREQSVKFHSKDIVVPSINDLSQIQSGLNHYKEMCVGCHGAPGVSPSEMSEGLNPEPPKLSEWKEELKQEELREIFWVIKNGIKMTGMPGFGATHSDEEIWGIVAFLNQLPNLSPEKYKAMVENTEKNDNGHDHRHNQEQNHGHRHEH